MAKDQLVAAIDIGSYKVACLIADVSEDGNIQIIGVSSIPSKGVKKGVIVDIDQAVDVLAEALEAAERMAGVTIAQVFVTVNGSHIASVNSQGRVSVSTQDGEITPADVERVIEAAKAISLPSNREVIHVIPRTFVLDQQEGIDDPIGMTGTHLQVETHIVTGAATSVRNLVKCIHEIGLDVENLIFTGIASSESVLTETEKELGVVLVDIGGGTTDIVIFHEGAPVYSSVIKLGGKNITSDIAIGLRVSIAEAEEIKKFISTQKREPTVSDRAVTDNAKTDDAVIDLSELNFEGIQSIERKFLVEGIIQPRLEEIAEEVGNEIKKSGYDELTPAGIVVCGGGAKTIDIESTFDQVLRMSIRTGEPTGVSGLIDEIKGSDYAASIGAIIHATYVAGRGPGLLRSLRGFKLPTERVSQLGDRVLNIFRGFLPKN